MRIRSFGIRFFVLKNDLLDLFGETAVGLPEISPEEAFHRLRKRNILPFLKYIFNGKVVAHQVLAISPTTFELGRHLDNISEKLIHLTVHFGDLVETICQAKRFCLGFKIGILSSRDLVLVYFSRTCFKSRFEGIIISRTASQ